MIFLILFIATKAPLCLYNSTKDSTYILLVRYNSNAYGLNIYLKEAEGFKKINLLPIESIKDPLQFRDILGDDYYLLMAKTKSSTPEELKIRLLSDIGTNFAYSLGYKSIAIAAGRLFSFKTELNKSYTLKIEFIDYSLKPIDTETLTVIAKLTKTPKPEIIEAKQTKRGIKIVWKFPYFSGQMDDPVTKFNILKKEEGGEWVKINPMPILREKETITKYDNDIIDGKIYYYKIVPITFIDQEGTASDIIKIGVKDIIPPRPPHKISAKGEIEKNIISWERSPDLDVKYYEIYRANAPTDTFNFVGKTENVYFEDNDVIGGKTYYYKLIPQDTLGNRGNFSSLAMATPKDTTPPLPPEEITVKFDKRKVIINWTASLSKDADRYNVYRKERQWLKLNKDELRTLEFKDEGYRNEGLYPGKVYEFAVTTKDYAGNESNKKIIEVEIPDDKAPIPPVGIYAEYSEEKVKITWQPNAEADFSHYLVKRDGEFIAETKEHFYVDTTVKKGNTYLYQISAVDIRKNESNPAEFKITVRDYEKPPAPAKIEAKITKEGVKIEWDAVKIDDLAGYNIYRSDAYAGIYKKLNEKILNQTQFIDKTGTEGNYYKIGVLDTSGNERMSQPAKAIK